MKPFLNAFGREINVGDCLIYYLPVGFAYSTPVIRFVTVDKFRVDESGEGNDVIECSLVEYAIQLGWVDGSSGVALKIIFGREDTTKLLPYPRPLEA